MGLRRRLKSSLLSLISYLFTLFSSLFSLPSSVSALGGSGSENFSGGFLLVRRNRAELTEGRNQKFAWDFDED
ncbi:hypothetical protein F2Q69_00049712 [Brassica cretica]|uniref:Uncharacterized protein n=1 Tax=Brassica cretica TaxID=69181 RepID=A0A8S9Q2T6_BRACR|nr:hypothetical protein F2Q69_00049712 [Brassica cretica]